jgi:hypothetical protein
LQKKLILQATTPGGGVSVIDLVPIDSVDDCDSSPVHVNISTDPLTGDDDAQQVTTVVQAQSPTDSGPHYITVTGEFLQFYFILITIIKIGCVVACLHSLSGRSRTIICAAHNNR